MLVDLLCFVAHYGIELNSYKVWILYYRKKIVFIRFYCLFLKGDIKITDSNAIIRYIARKNGLDGKTELEKVRIDMIENLSLDFYMEFAKIAYSPDFVRSLAFKFFWIPFKNKWLYVSHLVKFLLQVKKSGV